MTPPPDTKVQSETLEQIAERVVDENLDTYHYAFTRKALMTAVLSALRNERERAAKITEDVLPIGSDDCYWCERVQKAAQAIREGRQQ